MNFIGIAKYFSERYKNYSRTQPNFFRTDSTKTVDAENDTVVITGIKTHHNLDREHFANVRLEAVRIIFRFARVKNQTGKK